MKTDARTAFARLHEAVLTYPGECTPSIRQTIERHAAALSGRTVGPPLNVPAQLRPYVDKVTLHPYKILDEDIDALRDAGYPESAILELTLAAVVGAAAGRLERGLAAMREEG